MSVIAKNIVSNILGKGLSALLSLIFVPYYVRLLGAESYGLIGIFTTLQAIFMIADFGLSGAFIRETARLSVSQDDAQAICDVGRTFETFFIIIGIIVSTIIYIISPLLAKYWVNPIQLSLTTVSTSITLIGLIIGLQFPFFIYQGGLQGLQRQAVLNIFLAIFGLLKGLGSVLVLLYIKQSVIAFFVWQVLVSLLQLFIMRMLMWKSFPKIKPQYSINLRLIKPLMSFAAGMAGISLSGIFLTQIDKVILAKMLSLEKFGYYTLAWVVASVPGMIAIPIYNAIYPRFIQLVETNNFSELSVLYHRACQMLSVILLPLGLLFVFFSKEIMLAWTGSSLTAQNTYLFVSILVAGSTLMGLMMLPFALQLAFGWTRLNLIINIICSIILIPTLILLVKTYGALGACLVWVALYSIQLTVLIHFMHQRILKEEKWKWYINDIVKPLVPPLMVMFICRNLVNETMNNFHLIATIIIIFFTSVCTSAIAASQLRDIILHKVFCKSIA